MIISPFYFINYRSTRMFAILWEYVWQDQIVSIRTISFWPNLFKIDLTQLKLVNEFIILNFCQLFSCQLSLSLFHIQIIAALTSLTKLLELLFHIKVSNYVHEGTSRIASHMLNEIVKSISSTASMIYEHYKSVLRFCLHSLSFSVATHLVNQHYKACIRRGNAKEVICYIACTHIVGATGTTAGGAATGQVFTVLQF